MSEDFRDVRYKGCYYMGVKINKEGIIKCLRTGAIIHPTIIDGVSYSTHPSFARGKLPSDKLIESAFNKN